MFTTLLFILLFSIIKSSPTKFLTPLNTLIFDLNGNFGKFDFTLFFISARPCDVVMVRSSLTYEVGPTIIFPNVVGVTNIPLLFSVGNGKIVLVTKFEQLLSNK